MSVPEPSSVSLSAKDYRDRINVVGPTNGEYRMTYVSAEGDSISFNRQQQLFIMATVQFGYRSLPSYGVVDTYKWLEAKTVHYSLLKAVADTIQEKKNSTDAQENAYFSSVALDGKGAAGQAEVDDFLNKAYVAARRAQAS